MTALTSYLEGLGRVDAALAAELAATCTETDKNWFVQSADRVVTEAIFAALCVADPEQARQRLGTRTPFQTQVIVYETRAGLEPLVDEVRRWVVLVEADAGLAARYGAALGAQLELGNPLGSLCNELAAAGHVCAGLIEDPDGVRVVARDLARRLALEAAAERAGNEAVRRGVELLKQEARARKCFYLDDELWALECAEDAEDVARTDAGHLFAAARPYLREIVATCFGGFTDNAGRRVDLNAPIEASDGAELHQAFYEHGMTLLDYGAAVFAAIANGERAVTVLPLGPAEAFCDEDLAEAVESFLTTHGVDRDGLIVAGSPALFLDADLFAGVAIVGHKDVADDIVAWGARHS